MQNPAPPVILVTGAGGGFGQALVAEFLQQSCLVAAAYHRSNPHTESDQLCPVQLDVTDPTRTREVVQEVLSRWGRIDLLVNNAGAIADNLFWQIPEEGWENVLDVNLKGTFLCSQAVAATMIAKQQGHIINIASFSARAGPRGQANYAAAKAGVLGLTESLAKELGPHNIRVNAILPGFLPTPMTASLGKQTVAEFAAANALGRINSVAEVARFIAFLATLQNVSGQLFQLDSRISRWT